MEIEQVAPELVSGWLLFATYIAFLVLLPSGSIYGVNVKVAAFIPLVFYAVRLVVKEEDRFAQLAVITGTLAIICTWATLSLSNAYYSDLALSQTKDVLTTLAGCWFVRLFVRNDDHRKKFLRLCLYTVAFGCFTKLVILAYSLASGVTVSSIMSRISTAFGVTLMTVELGDAGGRIQFPSDNLLPICLFASIGLRRTVNLNVITSVAFTALFLFSSLYTFSRFIWLSAVLAIVLSLIIGRRDKLVYFYTALISAVGLYFFPLISALVSLRFTSALASGSDKDRDQQIPALFELFWRSPLFGNGLGSYSLRLVRSTETPYAYEIQVLALLAQLGLIGTALLLFLLFNYYRKAFHFSAKCRLQQIMILILLLDVLAAGFFNPSLLVSMSAVSYGLIFVLAGMSCDRVI